MIRFNLKKIILTFLTIFIVTPLTFASETYTLKVGVSIDSIPKEFYGTWRVSSKLVSTNSEGVFKEKNVDLWNLSRENDVIILENPFSSAKASIIIDEIKGNLIKFQKIGDYGGKKLTDTVKLNLEKETFSGFNKLKLDTISNVDGHVLNTQWAIYKLTGEKISGTSIK